MTREDANDQAIMLTQLTDQAYAVVAQRFKPRQYNATWGTSYAALPMIVAQSLNLEIVGEFK